ncbi:Protein of unknown function [Tenacibaculum sp. MAR_2009_124]|uniref:DUF2829 domain-containing protein n=1 Tax=Tenacibaculum sp. MAR_2009_124 TaxID=1250059 RepID=UPI00089AD29B|nr:DUF2829 domain-containing protein [Tenacibaculum sp. MAR_2009_124]SED11109.1 Protein of unknown function [Tenacibaculum sp. MAR_2009_124]
MDNNTSTVGTGRSLVDFGEAVKALKEGKRIQRRGWNGKGMFVFMQVPSSVPAEFVPKMSSLPETVKEAFSRRFDSMSKDLKGDADIRYQNQLAMVYPDNNIYGWLASPSDLLSEDWMILD